MRRETLISWFLGVAALAVAVGVGVQWGAARADREEVAALRARLAERDRVAATLDALRSAAPGEVELQLLRAETGAASEVEAELAAARRRLEEVRQVTAEKKAAFAHFPPGTRVPATAWRNAGGANPAVALETVLWSAAAGDASVFGARLRFVAGAEAAGQALLAALPPAARALARTPEEAVALLTLPDVPDGSLQVLEWSESPGLYQQVLVRLGSSDGSARVVRLLLGRSEDGWRLLVTPAVVRRCAAFLAAEAADAAPPAEPVEPAPAAPAVP